MEKLAPKTRKILIIVGTVLVLAAAIVFGIVDVTDGIKSRDIPANDSAVVVVDSVAPALDSVVLALDSIDVDSVK